MGGNHRHCLVPVLDLHSVQGNVDDITVCIELRHLDPVPHPHQVIIGQLNAGHQRENRVLKNQHEDCGHCTQTTQEVPWRLIHQLCHHEDDPDGIDKHLDELYVALDRPPLGHRQLLVEVVQGCDSGVDDPDHHQDHCSNDQSLQKPFKTGRHPRDHLQAQAGDDQWYQHQCPLWHLVFK